MSDINKMNEGDWICPDSNCGNINFARRVSCYRCNKDRPDGNPIKKKLGTEIGKSAAEKSRGLFNADDWQCNKCANVNWARRQTCNVCNAPKFGEVEARTGYGGGYNERGVVEYRKREPSSDDEYDEFGRKKKRRKSDPQDKVGITEGPVSNKFPPSVQKKEIKFGSSTKPQNDRDCLSDGSVCDVQATKVPFWRNQIQNQSNYHRQNNTLPYYKMNSMQHRKRVSSSGDRDNTGSSGYETCSKKGRSDCLSGFKPNPVMENRVSSTNNDRLTYKFAGPSPAEHFRVTYTLEERVRVAAYALVYNNCKFSTEKFEALYDKPAPDFKTIFAWRQRLLSTGCLVDSHLEKKNSEIPTINPTTVNKNIKKIPNPDEITILSDSEDEIHEDEKKRLQYSRKKSVSAETLVIGGMENNTKATGSSISNAESRRSHNSRSASTHNRTRSSSRDSQDSNYPDSDSEKLTQKSASTTNKSFKIKADRDRHSSHNSESDSISYHSEDVEFLSRSFGESKKKCNNKKEPYSAESKISHYIEPPFQGYTTKQPPEKSPLTTGNIYTSNLRNMNVKPNKKALMDTDGYVSEYVPSRVGSTAQKNYQDFKSTVMKKGFWAKGNPTKNNRTTGAYQHNGNVGTSIKSGPTLTKGNVVTLTNIRAPVPKCFGATPTNVGDILGKGNRAALTQDNVVTWSKANKDNFLIFNKDYVSTFPKEHVSTFTNERVSTFTNDKVSTCNKNITPSFTKNVSTFNKDNVTSFTKDNVATLTKDNVATFTKCIGATLTKNNVAILTKDNVATFTEGDGANLKKATGATLHTEKVASFSGNVATLPNNNYVTLTKSNTNTLRKRNEENVASLNNSIGVKKAKDKETVTEQLNRMSECETSLDYDYDEESPNYTTIMPSLVEEIPLPPGEAPNQDFTNDNFDTFVEENDYTPFDKSLGLMSTPEEKAENNSKIFEVVQTDNSIKNRSMDITPLDKPFGFVSTPEEKAENNSKIFEVVQSDNAIKNRSIMDIFNTNSSPKSSDEKTDSQNDSFTRKTYDEWTEDDDALYGDSEVNISITQEQLVTDPIPNEEINKTDIKHDRNQQFDIFMTINESNQNKNLEFDNFNTEVHVQNNGIPGLLLNETKQNKEPVADFLNSHSTKKIHIIESVTIKPCDDSVVTNIQQNDKNGCYQMKEKSPSKESSFVESTTSNNKDENLPNNTIAPPLPQVDFSNLLSGINTNTLMLALQNLQTLNSSDYNNSTEKDTSHDQNVNEDDEHFETINLTNDEDWEKETVRDGSIERQLEKMDGNTGDTPFLSDIFDPGPVMPFDVSKKLNINLKNPEEKNKLHLNENAPVIGNFKSFALPKPVLLNRLKLTVKVPDKSYKKTSDGKIQQNRKKSKPAGSHDEEERAEDEEESGDEADLSKYDLWGSDNEQGKAEADKAKLGESSKEGETEPADKNGCSPSNSNKKRSRSSSSSSSTSSSSTSSHSSGLKSPKNKFDDFNLNSERESVQGSPKGRKSRSRSPRIQRRKSRDSRSAGEIRSHESSRDKEKSRDRERRDKSRGSREERKERRYSRDGNNYAPRVRHR